MDMFFLFLLGFTIMVLAFDSTTTILKSRRTSPHIARVEAEVGKTTLCLTRDDEVFEVLVMTELKRHHGVTKAVFSELPGDRTA